MEADHRPPEVLWHYTNVAGLHGIVTSRSIWATDVRFMNDTREAVHATERARHVARQLEEVAASENEKLFLSDIADNMARRLGPGTCAFSLSEDGNLLSQWRAYCRSGGVAIGFRSDLLAEHASGQGFELVPCLYDEERQDEIIRELLWQACARFEAAGSPRRSVLQVEYSFVEWFLHRLQPLAIRFKHPSFREEREWRLANLTANPAAKLGWRVRGNLLVPYRLVEWTSTVQEVIVGPHRDQELLASTVQELIRSLPGCDRLANITSGIPYRPA